MTKYNLKDLTPEGMCLVGSCPAIYQDAKTGAYFLVGTQVNPSDVGLEGKVGKGEVLIKIPKNLIDNKKE